MQARDFGYLHNTLATLILNCAVEPYRTEGRLYGDPTSENVGVCSQSIMTTASDFPGKLSLNVEEDPCI